MPTDPHTQEVGIEGRCGNRYSWLQRLLDQLLFEFGAIALPCTLMRCVYVLLQPLKCPFINEVDIFGTAPTEK